jgi:hypothetical protein
MCFALLERVIEVGNVCVILSVGVIGIIILDVYFILKRNTKDRCDS